MSEGRMTVPERNDLKKLEAVIDEGMATFLKVGEALKIIRDSRLFREHYQSFEAYCEDRFDFGKSYASRLITAVETKQSLEKKLPIVNKLATETQFREIAKVPEEQVQAVLDKVVEESKETGKPITARAIKEAAEELAETEYEDVDPPEPATTAKPAKSKEQQLKELAALGSKYVDILMRTLDDMQGLKKSDRHESGLKSCRELKKFFGTW